MKVEIRSDSSTANSLTDRLVAALKKDFKMEVSVSRKFLQREFVQMLERRLSLLQYCSSIVNLQGWYSTDHGSHTPPQDGVISVESNRRRRFRTENRNIPLSGSVVYIETGAKLSETLGTVEELSTSHDEWTVTGEEEEEEGEEEEEEQEEEEEEEEEKQAMCNE